MREEYASCSLDRDSHDQPRGEMVAAVGQVELRLTHGVTQQADVKVPSINHPAIQRSAEQRERI